MAANVDVYAGLATLLAFPGPGHAAACRRLLEHLRASYPEAAAQLERFVAVMPDTTLAMQELHTRTFDVQAITTLDAGYVLFGDDYKRGALLASLCGEHDRAGNDCGGELADHLPNVLRLVPSLADDDLARELAEHILVPALVLMIREFEPDRVSRKREHYQRQFSALIGEAPGSDPTAYRHALTAAMHVLARDFGLADAIARLSDWGRRRETVDFLSRMRTECDADAVGGCAHS